jgi:hypothetical protein
VGYKESTTGTCGGDDLLQNENKNAERGGAGNEEAPAPHCYGENWGDFSKVPLGTSARKDEVVAMVGGGHRNPKKNHRRKHRARKKKKTLQAQPSEEKELWYTVRLFGTNSLKEGVV